MELRQLIRKRSSNNLIYRLKMDMMFEAYLHHESGQLEDDIPQTKEPVWILGKKYSAIHDFDAIKKDIKSRLWFSYRKGFVPIGDSAYTSDKGWGCMLRCGQMLIGQALINLHIGRDWEWRGPTCHDCRYQEVLRMFEDRKSAPYSIHQIALMGASEGKQVGDWFGPNTVAQVLKKDFSPHNKPLFLFHKNYWRLKGTISFSGLKKRFNLDETLGTEITVSEVWKSILDGHANPFYTYINIRNDSLFSLFKE